MQMVAVVPIFMSAGAAVLPTFLAALASLGAIMLKPRELLALCRRRPLAVLGMAVVIAGAIGVSSMLLGASRKQADSKRPDWAAVAQAIIARQKAGIPLTAIGSTATEPVATADRPSSSAGIPATLPATLPRTVAVRDVAHTHCDNSASPEHLQQFWAFRPENTMFLSKPAIAGGRIFVAGCTSELGDYVGLLACLDARTGKVIWQATELQGEPLKPFFSSPALSEDGGSLLIGQGLHQDRDCSLLCFDTRNGALRWSVKTPLHIESSPAVLGDLAVVGAGAIEGQDGRPTGDPGFVLAVRISDGKEMWRAAVNDPESSPTIAEDGTVYIGSGFNGNAVVALRSGPGVQPAHRVQWKVQTTVPMTGDITLAGDLVIAGGGNGDFVHSNTTPAGIVLALDRRTGATAWRASLPDSVLGSIAFRNGRLIVPCRSGEVYALAAESGKILWKTRVSSQAPVLAGCAFTDKRIYAATGEGLLAVLDAANGKVVEKIAINDPARAGSGLTGCPPQVADGRVIAGSETGGIQSFMGGRP